MSWQSSAQMHEARAQALAVELAEAKAAIAQLQDELTVAKEETVAAYQFTKPPVNIDTGTRVTNSGTGDVKLPDGSTGAGLAVLAAAVGVVLILWLFFNRK